MSKLARRQEKNVGKYDGGEGEQLEGYVEGNESWEFYLLPQHIHALFRTYFQDS
jgi:hypothetical protein